MRRLRRAVCALLSLPLIVLSAAQARGESSLSVTQAFVQGETLYVYLPVEEGLTAELYGAEGSIPAANGVQAVGEAETPVSYYLLVDDSQSMRSMKRKIESFASSLAQSSEAGTRFAVLTFGESLEVVQEKTQDADGALAALRGISYDGQMTDLPRGVLDALAYLESEPREEGELVEAVLISDGVTEEAADSPGLEAAQERASGASVVLHTLGLATARDVSAQGLSELSSLGKGVHAEIPTGVFDGAACAAEVAAYTDALSVLSFPLGREPASPYEGSVFFLTDDGALTYRANLEDVPVIGAAAEPVEEEPPVSVAASEAPVSEAPAEEPASEAPASEAPAAPSEPKGTSEAVSEAAAESEAASGLPAEDAAGDGCGSLVWILIAAAAVLAAACIAILVILLRRRRKSEPQPAPEQPASDSRSGIYMRLEMISGRHTGANELSLTEELTIGSAKTCSLIVEAPGVEPLPARIFVRGGLIYLEDLGSAGGTLLGGMRLQGPNRLRSGDEITVGGARFCLKF